MDINIDLWMKMRKRIAEVPLEQIDLSIGVILDKEGRMTCGCMAGHGLWAFYNGDAKTLVKWENERRASKDFVLLNPDAEHREIAACLIEDPMGLSFAQMENLCYDWVGREDISAQPKDEQQRQAILNYIDDLAAKFGIAEIMKSGGPQ